MRIWSILLLLSACAVEEEPVDEPLNEWVDGVECPPAVQGATAGYDEGDVVPEFELIDQRGDPTRLSDFCNNVVLVEVSSFF